MTTYRRKLTKCEAMQWSGRAKSIYVQPGPNSAQDIVAWVNANGGEAQYEPAQYDPEMRYAKRGENRQPVLIHGPRIAIRTSDGWAFAEPGWYVEKGDTEFCGSYTAHTGSCAFKGCAVRNFYPRDPETFEARWEKTI